MSDHRYSIIEQIDVGGMAEVWKGRAVSLQGFEKQVAIKRIDFEIDKLDEFKYILREITIMR